ncbi:MoxR family ATPase [bacterium]|nr:MoxR family ATPase [bacterium]
MDNPLILKANAIINEVKKVIFGQDEVIREIATAFLAGGHVLLEGVPGTAKTLLAKSFSFASDMKYKRIQFTPDMMPSDILGTNVFDMHDKKFTLLKGPVFTDVLLADEINRTPPKTQSALLEAMQERQVTIEGNRYDLGDNFFVLATQNPVEYEGTYPLPEAQTDRFLMKILIEYPSKEAEIKILKEHSADSGKPQLLEQMIEKVIKQQDMQQMRAVVEDVRVEEKIYEYIYQIIEGTRVSPRLTLGASPRAGIFLLKTAKVNALLEDRDYIIPDDVKKMAYPVLRHRLMLKPETEMDMILPDSVIEEVMAEVEVPR